MHTEIKSKRQIELLETLAHEIWMNHFGPMFENGILEYLIDKVQSKEAILDQIRKGYIYYFINGEHSPIGYFAYKLSKTKNELFLSKLYILFAERNKGIGRQVINFLEEICKKNNVSKFTLTVYHKNSSAIKAYEKLGFKNIGLIKREIGNNIIINDYQMEKFV
jgi:ribosomal protein S18 acetylase RimI-like enzyme